MRLNEIIYLIDQWNKVPVYTSFRDEIGEAVAVDLSLDIPGVDTAAFRDKMRHFLRNHEDEAALYKLRYNPQHIVADLINLRRVLIKNGVVTKDNLE